jgi:molybdenum cofactor cytidylyltransferase
VGTVALVIAADRGPGSGLPKQLFSVGGRPLIEVVVAEARAWPVDDIVVVLGSHAEDVLDGADLDRATVVIDPEWSEGSASPLRAGLDTITRSGEFETAVLAHGDQPGVPSEVVRVLLRTQREQKAAAAFPRYRYAPGWPIVVHDELWPWLLGLEGNPELLDLLRSHPRGAEEVWLDRLASPRIDREDDLA